MHACSTAIAVLIVAAAQGVAFPAHAAPLPAKAMKRQLSGLSAEEADRVIRQLSQAQQDLRAGKPASFELISGSVASWKQSNISPRTAFLQIPLQSAWSLQFLADDRSVDKTYRLYYAPEGLGKRYWDVRLDVDLTGKIDRVTLIYRFPPPF